MVYSLDLIGINDGFMDHGQEINFCSCALTLGAIGAEFLKAFKGYIENPTSMLL